jgi:hypothetical protein
MTFSKNSTAAMTNLLTVCKHCRQPNNNGYQYCSACHQKYKSNGRWKAKPGNAAASVPSITSNLPSSPQHIVDIEEVLRACGVEL